MFEEIDMSSETLLGDIETLSTELARVNWVEPHSFHGLIKSAELLIARPGATAWEWRLLHFYAQAVRHVGSLKGWGKLKGQLHSDGGFENQLLVTHYLVQ